MYHITVRKNNNTEKTLELSHILAAISYAKWEVSKLDTKSVVVKNSNGFIHYKKNKDNPKQIIEFQMA